MKQHDCENLIQGVAAGAEDSGFPTETKPRLCAYGRICYISLCQGQRIACAAPFTLRIPPVLQAASPLLTLSCMFELGGFGTECHVSSEDFMESSLLII